jgi:hypothetical protein
MSSRDDHRSLTAIIWEKLCYSDQWVGGVLRAASPVPLVGPVGFKAPDSYRLISLIAFHPSHTRAIPHAR